MRTFDYLCSVQYNKGGVNRKQNPLAVFLYPNG